MPRGRSFERKYVSKLQMYLVLVSPNRIIDGVEWGILGGREGRGLLVPKRRQLETTRVRAHHGAGVIMLLDAKHVAKWHINS